jgi:hypothetical protein
MVIMLTEIGEISAPEARAEGERLWLTDAELESATGWSMKPQGLCRDDVCVAIPSGREGDFRRAGRVDAAALWRHLGKPVARSEDGGVWALGEGARDRAAALLSLQAPDFTLPDPSGRMHSLSEHRGKKVLLVTWASW